MEEIKKHSTLGKLSFILASFVLFGIIIDFIILFSAPTPAMFNPLPYDIITTSFMIFMILIIISIILGIIAYLGKQKDKIGLSAAIIGIISILLGFLLLLMTFFRGMP
jgi:glucose uptake protein GlcU